MKAILLCAGYGTRLLPLTASCPKPLLPVADRPMLDYLMDQLLEMPRLDQVHVITNRRHLAAFEHWAPSWRARCDLKLHHDGTSENSSRLGASRDLNLVLDRIGLPERAFIASGDNILRFSLRPAWDRFLSSTPSLLLALHETDPEQLKRRGVLRLDRDDRVLELVEKPDRPPSEWVCPSLYFLNRAALLQLPAFLGEARDTDAIGNFVRFVVLREPVYALRVQGSTLHIGTPAAYQEADYLLRRQPVIPHAEA